MKQKKLLKKQHSFMIKTFSTELEAPASEAGQEKKTTNLTFLKEEKETVIIHRYYYYLLYRKSKII